MTGPLDEPRDATPLEPDEHEGLIPTWVTMHVDLNVAEAENIAAGAAWARRQRRDILTDAFVRELHERMFKDVWKWAGTYRLTERNIGVAPYMIGAEIRRLLDDAKYWVENGPYEPDEIAIRLHHRLVSVHPFPNGNGRHSRLMADLLAIRLGSSPSSWGRSGLTEAGETRARYIAALRSADRHDIAPLLEFAKS